MTVNANPGVPLARKELQEEMCSLSNPRCYQTLLSHLSAVRFTGRASTCWMSRSSEFPCPVSFQNFYNNPACSSHCPLSYHQGWTGTFRTAQPSFLYCLTAHKTGRSANFFLHWSGQITSLNSSSSGCSAFIKQSICRSANM